MNDENTIDAEELMLLNRYEKEFKETPPIAFLDPRVSKKLLKEALRSNIPFSEKGLDSLPDD